MSTARDIEGAMLERCLQIVTTPGAVPRDQAEANVCRLAGMIVDGRYPEAGKRLSDAATAYFADHPEQQVPSAEVVRRGWIINAPRLRDRLERLLAGFVGVSSCSENGIFMDTANQGVFACLCMPWTVKISVNFSMFRYCP